MRLKIRNFQSIRKAELEISGFTVITGPTNVGKTALIRAAQATFFGIPGDYFIREGETFTGVALFDDDLEIIWRKTKKPDPKKPSALQVNGVVHTKIGKDHMRLTEPCGIFELQTSQARIRPQFAMQHDSIFMLAETETTVAEVLKLLGRIDVVTTAQRNAKRDLSSSAMKRKVREGDLEVAKEKLKELEYVPGLRIKLEKVTENYQLMDKKNEERSSLMKKITRMAELKPHKIPRDPPVLSTEKFQLRDLLIKLEQTEPCVVPPAINLLPYDIVKPGLINWLRKLMQLDESLVMSAANKESLDEEIEDMVALRKIVEETLGVCPVCDRPFESGGADHSFPQDGSKP